MEVSESEEVSKAGSLSDAEIESIASQLLSDDEGLAGVVESHRQVLPELIHRAARLALERDTDRERDRFLRLGGRLVIYYPLLATHLEPWLAKVGPPWRRLSLGTAGEGAEMKRQRLDVSSWPLTSLCLLVRSCPSLALVPLPGSLPACPPASGEAAVPGAQAAVSPLRGSGGQSQGETPVWGHK